MIPWVNDLIKLNPNINIEGYDDPIKKYLKEIANKQLLVTHVSVDLTDFNKIFIEIDNGQGKESWGIRVPDGRFYRNEVSSPSLFILVSGLDECKIVKNSFYPIPTPGDEVHLSNPVTVPTGKYILDSCKCFNNDDGWPNKKMLCGPHIRGYNSIAYPPRKGWICNGVLYRKGGTSQSVPQSLQSENTKPESKVCHNCKSILVNPIPWDNRFKHCPKCEP